MRCELLSCDSCITLCGGLGGKTQGATGSPRSQTEVKLFCSPAPLRHNMLGSAKKKKKGHRGSLLCVTAAARGQTHRDLLRSYHSSSNYMKLLVYYRLYEHPAGSIKAHLWRRFEITESGKSRYGFEYAQMISFAPEMWLKSWFNELQYALTCMYNPAPNKKSVQALYLSVILLKFIYEFGEII